ncbi:hypothetical protein Pcinc_020998 [Petrolisthes cinctipes]|uniref:PiggyBac transposable element-derived protein domain-containing protein n=1 Tax=Petrolisthes cinctipes TaxID=88211 RepID=A0AAE1FI13_PETCI|nr:hypothetical protein Pcinc_020998 [Petrolisthes cinctipes]
MHDLSYRSDCSGGRVLVRKAEHASDIISNGEYGRWHRSSEIKDEVIYTAENKIKGDPQKMHTPVASSLTSNQLHTTSITLPMQSTSTQGQLPCEGRDAQVDYPVTPRHTNGKKRSRSTHIPPSSFTTTESVPTPAVPGPSTSLHASTQQSHPRQHNLTSSKKILPLLFLEDEDSGSEPDIISRDDMWLDDSAHSSSSDEDEENENYETTVNLSEVFSFSWSEGSGFVPDQHDFQPNSSGTTRDWPCNEEARESDFFCAFIDKELMSYIAEKTNKYYNWVSQCTEFISPGSRRQNWEDTTPNRKFMPKFIGEKNRVENPSSSDTPDSEEEAHTHHKSWRKRRKKDLFIQSEKSGKIGAYKWNDWQPEYFLSTIHKDITMLNAYNLWLFKKNFDRSKKPKLQDFVFNVAYQLLQDFGKPSTNTINCLPTNHLPDRIADAYTLHFPTHIADLKTGRNKMRDCYVCKHTTLRPQKRTRGVIICKECNIGLCIGDCFRDYHTLKIF